MKAPKSDLIDHSRIEMKRLADCPKQSKIEVFSTVFSRKMVGRLVGKEVRR